MATCGRRRRDVSGTLGAECTVDPDRRGVDGRRLADRRRPHGDHDRRPAVGAGGVQHCQLYAASVRTGRGAAGPVAGARRPGNGALGTLGNVLWLVLAGWWLALGHLLTAIGLALTIIGIPFAWAHLKLAGVSLWPVGRAIVTTEEAERLQGGSAAGFNLSVGGR